MKKNYPFMFYIIPEIKRKSLRYKGFRCADCKYFGYGHVYPNRLDKTKYICLQKPKASKSKTITAQCYYAASWLDKVCDMFQPKPTQPI